MLISQVLVNGWITCTHYGWGPQIFQHPSGHLKKTRCQKIDIKEVHNLKFRHCLGVVAHMIWKYLQYICHFTHSCKWLSSLGTLEMGESIPSFGDCTQWNPQMLLWKKIKHDILSVSKSVAWHQMYMHMKACLAAEYICRASRQFKMIIPAIGKVNYTQAKGYCPFSLLPFMQKF